MKLFFLLVLALLVATLAAQQHTPVKSVPAAVENSFSKENPDASPRWVKEDTNYRAEFVDMSNVPHVRVYDPHGRMVYRDDVMDAFPQPIHAYYTSKYPGEGFVTWSRIDASGKLTYFTYHNTDTLWFDKDGQLLLPRRRGRPADSISVFHPMTSN